MWQAPNQRIRAQANARKRERDRFKIPFHIKRVVANVQLEIPGGEPQKFEARALLNDFSPKGMGLFSSHRFSQGDEIVVTIENPEKIEVRGKIAWCQEYFAAGKVLKSQAFSYRAGVRFTFATADDEAAVRKFCMDLLNKHHCVSLRPGERADDSLTIAATNAVASVPPSAPAPEAAAAVMEAPAAATTAMETQAPTPVAEAGAPAGNGEGQAA